MKLLIRYFSLGLFTAGILLLGVFLLSDNQNVEELSVEEIIPVLKNEGYHVMSNDEYISITLNADDGEDIGETESKEKKESNKEEEKKEVTKKDKKQEDDKKVEEKDEEEEKAEDEDEKETNTRSSYTLNIQSGMPTSRISSELEQNGIIESASEFTKYLEDHDYALKVKAKKVEVHSDMSHYELAHALINY